MRGLPLALRLIAAGARSAAEHEPRLRRSSKCGRILPMSACALLLVTLHPGDGHAKTPVAWVELVGPGAQASIRVIVDKDAGCPTLMADGEPLAMRVRAEPGPLLREGKPPPPADFPVRVCEVPAPPGKRVQLDGQPLPLPPADIHRIVVFGDTGCRIKEQKKPQNCAKPGKWPYARVAEHAAQARPDLVIHVGDYLYREKCDVEACAGEAVGYGWKGWDADFFTPSAKLFAAAPWIMVRGNHESCSRAAEGWFRFLYHGQPGSACTDTSPFFVVDLGSQSFVVMDSSAVAGTEDAAAVSADDDDDDDDADDRAAESVDELTAKIRTGYEAIAPSIPSHAWLLTHSPFYGVRLDKQTEQNRIDNTIEFDALGAKQSPNIQMIVSGHIHMFEALSFARNDSEPDAQWPPQLIVGTGGDKLAKEPQAPDKLFDRQVAHALILRNFAYMILDREGASWKGSLFDQDGALLAKCELANRDLACRKQQ